MRNQLKNQRLISYKELIGQTEKQDLDGNYTGEIVDNYGDIEQIRVVVSFLKGKIYNEQMGIIYEYAATLQHTGESIIKEGSLIWLRNATTEDADYIVKGIVPSLNSVIYHLIKKEV